MSAHQPLAQVAHRSTLGQWAAAPRVLVGILLLLGWVAPAPATAAPVRMDNASDITDAQPVHLLVSEAVTGGSSASDEFVEIFNPGPAALPLEGLELVYVTATGATITRKASWAAGDPGIPSHHHLLVANAAGIYAGIADTTYASGLAATGGSMALRIQGAATAIDALGWGTAASTWMEGTVAPAPPTGASLERLPGGSAGSGQDTDDNLADFAIRALPDPQNSTASPTPDASSSPSPTATSTPGASATPTPTATVTPTPTPSPTATPSVAPSPSPSPTATPARAPISIAAARDLPDGSTVLVGGVALSGSAFSDGGGYIDDGSAGIAVLLADGAFERGDQLTVAGTIDDRYAQRTLRAGASDLAITGMGSEPAPAALSTGAVGEQVEGRLVTVSGQIQSAATALSGGLAFDLDDGSGALRIFVASAAAIATDGWSRGATLTLVGVVGQRDSSGTGTAGYRVQPRDPADILQLLPAATPSPVPSPTPSPTATPTASPVPTARPTPTPGTGGGSVVSIAAARAASTGTRLRIRGTVTLSSGVLDAGSATIQDISGGILIRLGDEAGSLRRGEQVDLGGTRSTKSGMLTLRVTEPPISRSAGVEPVPVSLRTGSAGEQHEARLIEVRGAIVTAPRRSSAGSISFDLDDGSGALRVFVPGALASEISVPARGAWIEMVGVLGQETTGALPLRGYRLWPRAASDLRLVSLPVESVPDAEGGSAESDEPATGNGAAGNLGGLLPGANGGAAASGMVRATLVHGTWPELGLAGLLWDGRNLVGIVDGIVAEAAVNDALAGAGAPIGVQLQARTADVGPAPLHLPLITLRTDDRLERSAAPPTAPVSITASGSQPAWARLVGTLTSQSGARLLVVGGAKLVLERHCADPADAQRKGLVMIEGILVARGQRLVIGCDAMTNGPTLGATGTVHPLGDPVRGDAKKGAIAAVRGGNQPALPPIVVLIAAGGALALLGLAAGRSGLLARLVAAARREPLDPPDEGAEESAPGDKAATSVDGGLAPLRLVEPVGEVELPLRR